jgi:hypothetical protein
MQNEEGIDTFDDTPDFVLCHSDLDITTLCSLLCVSKSAKRHQAAVIALSTLGSQTEA